MTNYLRELHPWSAIVYLLMVLVLIMTSPYEIQMVYMFLLMSLNCMFSSGVKKYVKSLKLYIVMIVFLAVFNVIFNPMGDTPFLYINGRPLTKESFQYGMYMGFMVSSLFLWFQLFSDVFDNRKITYLIGSRLPVTGLIISMVFCYYDKFITKIDKIKEVWDTYALKVAQSPIKKAGITLSVLLSVMLEDSVDTAMSMNARGYGKGKRTQYICYSFQFMDGVLLVTAGMMLGINIWNPTGKQVCVWIFMLLPVVYNIVKELQWKFYLSKI